MKKLLCSIVLLVSFCSVQAQNAYTDSPGRWRLGLNMGAIWESSDVKAVPGLGGGFNIEKILNKRQSAPIGFSLGFRYLGGRTYGLNTAPTWNLQDNKALNGTYDSTLRYDSVPGYFYANHKTFIQEGALEFKVNFPRFEQRTHIILHFWGGVGIGKYKTWIDAKDKAGNMYDFTSTKAQTMNQSDLSRIFNGSYETLAEGSGTNGTIRFIPSVGVGLGVRLSKYVALVFEHKISFPMTDALDGYKYGGSCVNDFYHYTAANLIFTVHAKSSSSTNTHTNTDQTVYTNTTVTTNTTTAVTTTTTPTATTATTPTVTNIPKESPPAVNITYPHNNFYSQYDNVSVSAQLTSITKSQQISITLNGYPLTHFSYNPSNGMLNFESFLALGNNYFIVTGTNSAGSANDQVNVIYAPTATVTPTATLTNVNPTNTVTVHTNTPTVTPTNTVVSTPTITPTQTVTVNTPTVVATTTTVASPTITPTHTTITTHTVVPTHTVAAETPTVTPTNTVVSVGTPTSTVAGKPPIITIINPSVNPYEENSNQYNVSGSVLNVDNASQISLTINGSPITQFSFGQNNKMLSFWAPLQTGANTIVIKATNNYGSDNKSTVINHKPGKPPKVVISVPASSPYTSLAPNTTVSGSVYSVNSSNDITVMANGYAVPFSYVASTNAINVPLILQAETTQVVITGTNPYGSDSQSTTIILKKTKINTTPVDTGGVIPVTQSNDAGPLHRKPTITVNTPVADPFYTNNSNVNVSATVGFVLTVNGVTVTYNGAPVTSVFDPNTHKLDFSAPLVSGMNSFVITAMNHDGITTHTVNVNYTPINNPGNSTPANNQNNNQGGGGKPNIFQPKINTGGGGIVPNPGKPINNENKGETKPETKGGGEVKPNNQPLNNVPRSINTPSTAPAPGGGGRTMGTEGGGRTMGTSGGGQ